MERPRPCPRSGCTGSLAGTYGGVPIIGCPLVPPNFVIDPAVIGCDLTEAAAELHRAWDATLAPALLDVVMNGDPDLDRSDGPNGPDGLAAFWS